MRPKLKNILLLINASDLCIVKDFAKTTTKPETNNSKTIPKPRNNHKAMRHDNPYLNKCATKPSVIDIH